MSVGQEEERKEKRSRKIFIRINGKLIPKIETASNKILIFILITGFEMTFRLFNL